MSTITTMTELMDEVIRLREQLAETETKTKALCCQNGALMIENHDIKQQLAKACRIIRDGYGVVPITPADVDWAIQALAKEVQP